MDIVYLDKIEHEFNSIKDTEFWKLYQKRLMELRQQASRRCETESEVIRYQERVRAIDEFMELSRKIINDLKSK